MPARISERKLNIILDLINTDIAPGEIARLAEVHYNTVYKINLSIELFGTPYPPRIAVVGRPRILTIEEEEAVIDYLHHRPDSYADEVTDFLAFEYGIEVDIYVIYRLLSRRRWSKKVAKRQYIEQNQELRDWWLGYQLTLESNRLVFLDESGTNRRTGFRRFGWSEQGVRPVHQLPSSRGDKWSIVPAITVDGYLDNPLICRGSANQAMFTAWVINEVLPQLEPGMILIMDNASIHKDPELLEECQQYGVEVEFLPPYCPEFNPIELSFNVVKAWLRRHSSEVFEYDCFGDFLAFALSKAITPAATRGFFRKSGYFVE